MRSEFVSLDLPLKNRIILTKDKLLSHRASKEYIRNLYINEKDLALRLALIKKAFNIKTEILPPPKGKSRCPLCNSEIIEVKDKKTIKNRIFPSTYEHFDEFWMCSNEKCQKIYYVGEHWKDFEMTSKKIDEILKVI